MEALSVAGDGLVADYLAVEELAVDEVRPAVMVFSGSGGGHPGPEYLPALHQAGFHAMALSYFGAPGLPEDLHEIPLEYFHRALAWLRAQPHVDPEGVFLMTRSRGTEAAQHLALQRPAEIAGLILGVPSYVVVQAWPRDGAAWTLGGEPLTSHPDGWPTGDFPLDPPAAIPLEQFPGPVLLVAGGNDTVWPSSAFARVIRRRRDAAGRTTELLDYPAAGHAVGRLLNLAEEAAEPADFAARQEVWPQVIAFLRRYGTTWAR